MANPRGIQFGDATKLASYSDVAPPSEYKLLQQQQERAQHSSVRHGVEESQRKLRGGREEKQSAASKQGGRSPPLVTGIRGITGPRASLYSFAFKEWGGRDHDRSGRQSGDEGRGSPAVASRIGSITRATGANRRPHPALSLTRDMCATYSSRNPLFRFTPNVPRRILTVPSSGAGNNGLDNSEFNLIARVNDVLEAPKTNYSVLDMLGQGTFGQVFRCQDHATKDIVAIKVVKNKLAYRNQALLEIQVAKLLNERYDPNNTKNIVRLLDCFQFQNHLCLVFELLSINIFELLKYNQFRGLPLLLIRHFIKQILEALEALQQANVIHCDLKPENVLLTNKASGVERDAARGGGGGVPDQREEENRIKVIDFGSACFEGQTMYSYIQSRFYRSPEVLLGLPYDGAIDIWSLGCITVELFLGLPIFPGVSDHNQICRIVEMVGNLPEFMLENGKDTLKFFKRVNVPASEGIGGVGEKGARGWRAGADMAVSPDRDGRDGRDLEPGRERGQRRSRGRGYRHVLKTPEEYARDTGTAVPQLKKYFKHSTIPNIIQSYPLAGATHRRGAGGGNTVDTAQEKEARRVFTHFVLGLLNPNPWKRWTPKQASSHPFITGQPHPRDLGALTIADDPLISNRRSRQMHAMQIQQQKDQQEAERKHAQWLRQHRQQQDQQKRDQRRGMAIPGASQSRGISTVSGVSLAGSGTPGSIGNRTSFHQSPMQHGRRNSSDGGLMSMQIAHTPQGLRGEDHGFGSTSRPIDVPAGGIGGGGLAMQHMLNRDLDVVGGTGDLTARSMGCPTRGAAGISYPPRLVDGADFDAGGGEAYSYSAASFTMGGASGNFVASDFGYALQRPGLRYEPTYKPSPPATHSSSHVGSGSLHLQRRRASEIGPGMALPGSYTSYHHQSDGLRGLERGARALSMDQSQTAGTHYYMGGGAGALGGQLARGGGHFAPQSTHYASSMQQTSTSVSASTAGPTGYTPIARGGYVAPPSAFRSDAPQASVPWVRAGRGIGQGQPMSIGPRAHSTSPVFGRLGAELPSDHQDHEIDPQPDDVQHTRDGSLGGSSGDIWAHHVAGVESDDHPGRARRGRHAGQRGRRQDLRRGLATDPGVGSDGGAFAFQLDDGLPVGVSSGGLLGGPSQSSPLDWMGGGRAVGMDDPEGVHKRSLNGTSKGIPPTVGASAVQASPHDDGDLIRRVACDESPGVMQQQPAQSESLLSQQLMQYQHQKQLQRQDQPRSRTPFGSVVQGAPSDHSLSPVPHKQLSDSAYGVGGVARSSAEQTWLTGRAGGHGGGLDDNLSDQSVDMGAGASAWGSSSSTRALRRRGSSGSSEFYFVDTLQQGGSASTYTQPPISPAGPSSSRSAYAGRGRASSGSTPAGFRVGLPQHSQGQAQGQQSSMPPRPPRPSDNPTVGMDKGSWSGSGVESNWGPLASPLQTTQQRLPTTPRSIGSRGSSMWDDRGTLGGGDAAMRSIEEGDSYSNT